MVLPATKKDYGDVIVKTRSLTEAQKNVEFVSQLLESLEVWEASGVEGVIFNVDLKDSSIIPILAEHDFTFAHSNYGTELTMVRWLSNTSSMLLEFSEPSDCTTWISASITATRLLR
ncbi:hypothetical protein RB195_007198 [Necator americanus]